MTVRALIERLERMPQDAAVVYMTNWTLDIVEEIAKDPKVIPIAQTPKGFTSDPSDEDVIPGTEQDAVLLQT